MSSNRGLVCVYSLLLIGAASRVSAQVEGTVFNWTVPPYRVDSSGGGIRTMADISPGVVFVAMQPCRVLDTRGANGPYGGPRLVANQTRNFDIDSGPCTGIPADVEAYSMNFGAIFPDGASSFITIWPTGSAQPVVSSINPILGGVVANAAVVPAGTNGQISVLPNTGVHLYGDINGYFTDALNAGNQVVIVAGVPDQGALRVENTAVAATATAVLGTASATTGITWGVLGITNSNTDISAGIRGAALGASGKTYGVFGQTNSNADAAAGVRGVSGTSPSHQFYDIHSAGVRGESALNVGVAGLTNSGVAVIGSHINAATGQRETSGSLGPSATVGLSVVGNSALGGNLTVTGTIVAAGKSFIQPHPFDASKQIRYVSLEGPHSEVYFRGMAQVSQGVTRIPIPEDFRLVSDPATYSTLVTPVGAMATVAVMSQGEGGIVIQASRNVKVAYVVYAEREAMGNPEPIVENVDFRPEPDSEVISWLPDSYRRLMIQNGTLNPDGTVNLETAARFGWDKEWEKRDRPAPQPAE